MSKQPATTFAYTYKARVTVYTGPRGDRRVLEVVNVEGSVEGVRDYFAGEKKAIEDAKREAMLFAGVKASHARIETITLN